MRFIHFLDMPKPILSVCLLLASTAASAQTNTLPNVKLPNQGPQPGTVSTSPSQQGVQPGTSLPNQRTQQTPTGSISVTSPTPSLVFTPLGGKVVFGRDAVGPTVLRRPIPTKPFTQQEILQAAPKDRVRQLTNNLGYEVLIHRPHLDGAHIYVARPATAPPPPPRDVWIPIGIYVTQINQTETWLNQQGRTLRDAQFAGRPAGSSRALDLHFVMRSPPGFVPVTQSSAIASGPIHVAPLRNNPYIFTPPRSSSARPTSSRGTRP